MKNIFRISQNSRFYRLKKVKHIFTYTFVVVVDELFFKLREREREREGNSSISR